MFVCMYVFKILFPSDGSDSILMDYSFIISFLIFNKFQKQHFLLDKGRRDKGTPLKRWMDQWKSE